MRTPTWSLVDFKDRLGEFEHYGIIEEDYILQNSLNLNWKKNTHFLAFFNIFFIFLAYSYNA